MKREISFCETFKPSYNYFDCKAENNNANEIKALILVQTDLVRDVLTDRQREAILLTVCDRLTLSAAARQMGISDCSVCRARQSGLDKLRKYPLYAVQLHRWIIYPKIRANWFLSPKN